MPLATSLKMLLLATRSLKLHPFQHIAQILRVVYFSGESSSGWIPQYFWRIVHPDHMDIEMTCSQMMQLCYNPNKVYVITCNLLHVLCLRQIHRLVVYMCECYNAVLFHSYACSYAAAKRRKRLLSYFFMHHLKWCKPAHHPGSWFTCRDKKSLGAGWSGLSRDIGWATTGVYTYFFILHV